jgi:choline kinase
MKALILAAGGGTRAGGVCKPLLVLPNGKPLIVHTLDMLDELNLDVKPTIVVGCMAERVITQMGARAAFVFNPQFESTSSMYSLLLGLRMMDCHKDDSVLIIYGDTLLSYVTVSAIAKHRGSVAVKPYVECNTVLYTDRDYISYASTVEDRDHSWPGRIFSFALAHRASGQKP